MEYTVNIFKEKIDKNKYSHFVLGADLGGTNSNFAVAGIVKTNNNNNNNNDNNNNTINNNSEPLDIIFTAHFPSKKLRSIVPAFKEVISEAQKNYGIILNRACIGAGGPSPVDAQFVNMSNASWNVDTNEIIKQTSLKSILLINDFQTLGFALNILFKNPDKIKKELIIAQKGSRTKADSERGTKAVLGGGTGLGSCMLVYDDHTRSYKAINTEMSWSDFVIHTKEELEFAEFVKKRRNSPGDLALDEVISGRGILSIYEFLRNKKRFPLTQFTKEISKAKTNDKPALISKYKNKDRACMETFRLFAKFYGRVAKNFTLGAMAFGGLYIAGGIAAKNPEIFKTKKFKTEFVKSIKYAKLLKSIPIYIVKNYDISLYGACYAAMQIKEKIG